MFQGRRGANKTRYSNMNHRSKGKVFNSRIQSSSWTASTKKSTYVAVTVIMLLWCLSGSQWLGSFFRAHHPAPSIPGFSTLPSPWTQDDVNLLNQHLTKTDDILLWIHANLRESLVSVTSFGPSGLVILHRLHALELLKDIPVITIDTLHLFPETLETTKTVEKLYADEMRLHVYSPKDYSSREGFDQAYGQDFYKTHPDEYGYYTKVEPMLRALQEKDVTAWITGRRRDQGGERSELHAFELVEEDGGIPRIKVNPLYDWTYDQVWNYLRQHKLPYNPLHDKGYKSIGDVMTTRAVEAGAPERSGRFVGMNKTECGLHSHLEKVKRLKAEAESRGEELETPKLICNECIEVSATNFDQIVLNGSEDLLFEFYSPFCGACQYFAPTFHKVEKRLSEVSSVKAARFDVTTQSVPKSGVDVGLDLDSTPQLFLILRKPSFHVIPYKGDVYEYDALKSWIHENGFKNF